jgi:SAM-dependent methyltransferase
MGQNTPVERIREYWDEKAHKHGGGLAATTPDPLAKELEIAALKAVLDPGLDTLEVGCGNGYNLFALADMLSGKLTGVDFAPAMIAVARGSLATRPDARRFHFEVASVLDDLGSLGKVSQIFTDRCLINLTSIDEQVAALENLGRLLPVGGKLALIESTQQGQERINALRLRVGLDPIPYHWHNLYLDEAAFLKRMPRFLSHVATDNFASLYFVISRVFNAKLTAPGQAPDYMSEINRLAAALPSFGDCAPLKLFLYEKTSA